MSEGISSLPALFAAGTSNAALVTFIIYTLAVFGLAALSNHLMKGKNFLSEYFLGSRGLGVWAFALTFAATSASGGSFTGFPSKIYTHGWILGLWIGSYIVVPICAMGLLGKRINQVARISGAITVPDVLRDRLQSAKFGLLAVILIVFFMSFNLVAQFKAGSLILKTLLDSVTIFKTTAVAFGGFTSDWDYLKSVDPEYLLCLLTFGIAVIVYTTYGGFHAVVWTDVMQGIVMVVGVLIMLPLAIYEVGGLENATKTVAKMTPPRRGIATIVTNDPGFGNTLVSSGTWLTVPNSDGPRPRLFRVTKSVIIQAGQPSIDAVPVLEITTPHEIDDLLADDSIIEISTQFKLINPPKPSDRYGTVSLFAPSDGPEELEITKGAWVKIPVKEGEQPRVAQIAEQAVLKKGKQAAIAVTEPTKSEDVNTVLAGGPDIQTLPNLQVISASTKPVMYRFGDSLIGVYVTGPGPHPTQSDGFLPLSLGISFFFMWAISGAGQPSSMVRLMAFKDSNTLRRSIFAVAIYYSLIYFPLVIIFCCARILLPGMDAESDSIMPKIAVLLTENIGAGWLAGLLVAAPFAAVMSTVDSFLLMISSALVRDVYQRNINPDVQEKTIKILSYTFTLLVGSAAMYFAIKPADFLQDIIVYTGSGLAACFLAPMVFTLYWPRANAYGCIAGMLAGFAAHLSMYFAGIFTNGSFFHPHRLFNFDPIIVGLFVSFAAVYFVTKMTPPPPKEIVQRYFYKNQGKSVT